MTLAEAKCLGEVVGFLFGLWMKAVGKTALQRFGNTVEVAHDGVWLAQTTGGQGDCRTVTADQVRGVLQRIEAVAVLRELAVG